MYSATMLISLAILLSLSGQVRADTAACYAIGDADARTYCLARERREPAQCYAIQRSDLRAQCLAEVRK